MSRQRATKPDIGSGARSGTSIFKIIKTERVFLALESFYDGSEEEKDGKIFVKLP
jgi:hypothetical protein